MLDAILLQTLFDASSFVARRRVDQQKGVLNIVSLVIRHKSLADEVLAHDLLVEGALCAVDDDDVLRRSIIFQLRCTWDNNYYGELFPIGTSSEATRYPGLLFSRRLRKDMLLAFIGICIIA